jgi:hypothetical protein
VHPWTEYSVAISTLLLILSHFELLRNKVKYWQKLISDPTTKRLASKHPHFITKLRCSIRTRKDVTSGSMYLLNRNYRPSALCSGEKNVRTWRSVTSTEISQSTFGGGEWASYKTDLIKSLASQNNLCPRKVIMINVFRFRSRGKTVSKPVLVIPLINALCPESVDASSKAYLKIRR